MRILDTGNLVGTHGIQKTHTDDAAVVSGLCTSLKYRIFDSDGTGIEVLDICDPRCAENCRRT